MIVTPSRGTPPGALGKVTEFWSSLGARVLRMTPSAHDRVLAGTSHLPHLVASVLAAATDRNDLGLTGRGWLDTTRVAAGEAELWQQILLSNRRHVLKSLDKFEKVLNSLRQAIHDEDAVEVRKILEAGKRNRDAVAD